MSDHDHDNSSHPERRAHPRCALELWVDETTGDVTYYQRTANVSLGGMFISGTIPHPPGTRVRVEFAVPGDPERFRLNGEVIADEKSGPVGMRLRFIDLADDVRERLQQALGNVTG